MSNERPVPFVPDPAPARASIGLKVLSVLCLLFLTIGMGLIVGFLYSFSECFKQECSDFAAAGFVLGPLAGLAVALVMIGTYAARGNKSNEHRGLLLVSPILTGLIVLSLLAGNL